MSSSRNGSTVSLSAVVREVVAHHGAGATIEQAEQYIKTNHPKLKYKRQSLSPALWNARRMVGAPTPVAVTHTVMGIPVATEEVSAVVEEEVPKAGLVTTQSLQTGLAAPITSHEGRKYLRKITSCVDGSSIDVDVYDVLEAFEVTCPAQAHALKKLLVPGGRGKGDALADLVGAKAAINRAIQLQARRDEVK